MKLKFKELIIKLLDTQNNINSNLEKINKSLQIKLEDDVSSISSHISATSNLQSDLHNLEANVYNKSATIDVINKEYDYRNNYENCKKENACLLDLVEKYCKYSDKYNVIEVFNTLNEQYKVSSK